MAQSRRSLLSLVEWGDQEKRIVSEGEAFTTYSSRVKMTSREEQKRTSFGHFGESPLELEST